MNRIIAATRFWLIYFDLVEMLPVETKGKMQMSRNSSTDSGRINWTAGVKDGISMAVDLHMLACQWWQKRM